MTTTKALSRRIEVHTQAEAWQKVNEIFPTDYELDQFATKGAGYPVYRSTDEGHYYDYICDLNDRLEINLGNGKTVNVWFSDLYWNAIENEELKKRIAKLESRIAELKEQSDLDWEALKQLRNKNQKLEADLDDAITEIASLKKNGYRLMNDLIA